MNDATARAIVAAMNGQLALVTEATWSERARAWIEGLSPGYEFTAETVRRAVGEPEDANAIGAVVMRASKQRLIRWTGQDERTSRAIARGRYVRRLTRTDEEVTR